jgi:hypothetical protein
MVSLGGPTGTAVSPSAKPIPARNLRAPGKGAAGAPMARVVFARVRKNDQIAPVQGMLGAALAASIIDSSAGIGVRLAKAVRWTPHAQRRLSLPRLDVSGGDARNHFGVA